MNSVLRAVSLIATGTVLAGAGTLRADLFPCRCHQGDRPACSSCNGPPFGYYATQWRPWPACLGPMEYHQVIPVPVETSVAHMPPAHVIEKTIAPTAPMATIQPNPGALLN